MSDVDSNYEVVAHMKVEHMLEITTNYGKFDSAIIIDTVDQNARVELVEGITSAVSFADVKMLVT